MSDDLRARLLQFADEIHWSAFDGNGRKRIALLREAASALALLPHEKEKEKDDTRVDS